MTDRPPASEEPPEAWVQELALLIARCRQHSPTMDGAHNPRPSEVIAARRFIEIYDEARATPPALAALQNLDEVWSMKNTTLPEHDLTLPLVIRNFIASIRTDTVLARLHPTKEQDHD